MISIDGRRKSEDEWQTRIDQMLSFAGAHTSFPISAPSRDAEATVTYERVRAARSGGRS